MSRYEDEQGGNGSSPIDWHELVARHEEDPAAESTAWREALEIFDTDPNERERALDADPLLLFRSLPEPEVSSNEIEAMKGAVAQLRRAKAVEAVAEESGTDWSFEDGPGSRVFGRRVLGHGIGRWLSAAALAMVSLSALVLTGTDIGPRAGSPDAGSEVAALVGFEAPTAASEGWPRTDAGSPALSAFSGLEEGNGVDVEQLPLIEDIGPSVNLVMQLEADGVDVVVLTAEPEESNPT